ncbi:MAG: two-component regulator propeller domain-containing protein [Bacteroidales bacterium]
MVQKIIFFLLFTFLSAFYHFGKVEGQFQNYEFQKITINDGLSNNRVQALLRDSRGYLWIGTPTGLNRFDGLIIQNFLNVKSNSNTLLPANVQCLIEDLSGNIWIGASNGLFIYDRIFGSFKQYFPQYKENNLMSRGDFSVFSVMPDKQSNIWITTETGLKKLDVTTGRILQYDLPEKAINSQDEHPVRACFDKHGSIWLVNQNEKLWRFNINTERYESFTDEIFSKALENSKTIAIDSSGTIWIGTEGNGLFSYNPLNRKFNHLSTNGNNTGTQGKFIKSLFVEGSSYLYIAVDLGGINRLDLTTGKFEYCRMDKSYENGLNSDAIWSVYKDNEGILYAGTSVTGLNISNPKSNRFKTYKSNSSDENSLIYNVIFKFFEDSEGKIWIGTDGGGLSIFDPATGKFTNYRHNPSDPNSISGNAINAFAEDKEHNVWIGAWGAGLNRFDRKTKKFYHYMPDDKDTTSILNPNVWDLYPDSTGKLWISYNYGGVDLFDIKKGVVKRFRQDKNYPKMYSPSMTNRIVRHLNGETGLASHTGYYVYDKKIEGFRKTEIFGNDNMLDVYLDSKGNYWGGTSNKGLMIARKNGTFEYYNESNGFPSNTVSGFLEDKNGNIWILTSAGLVQYLISSGKFRQFNQDDGLVGKQFMTFSFLKAKDGTFYIGGYNGFNTFKPEEIKVNNTPPKIYIDEFKLSNETVWPGTKDSPLKHSITETSEIRLAYYQKEFTFGFTAISFTYPQKCQYAYKMEGYDKKWNYTDNQRRFATYTNLDPGDYTFMVKACNNDGLWNEIPASIHIVIVPPLWQTLWFRILMSVMFVAFLTVIYKLRIKQFKRNRLVLEQKVRERTIELEAANLILKEKQQEILNQNESIVHQRDILDQKKRELEVKNQEIIEITSKLHESDQMKMRFFTNVSHDLRTPLTLILGSIESVLPVVLGNPFLSSRITIVEKNARRMLRLVNQLLDFRKIDTESLKINAEFHDVVNFIKNVFDSFALNAEKRNINYVFESKKDTCYTWFDPDILDKILYNLISNAFKFTPDEGQISIRVNFSENNEKQDVNQIIIKIIDNGIGIHKKDQQKIFERFFQVSNAYSRKYQGSGIGLSLVKHLVELSKGKISVKSEPGQGSEFEVLLPVGVHSDKSEPLLEIISGSEEWNAQSQFISDKEELKPKTLFDGSKILIVEDNDDLRAFIRDEIKLSYKVVEARDGKEGYRLAKYEIPDLIVSDVMMPQMDGFELCSQLKFDWQTSHIPILILTAKSDEASLIHGLEIGADAYISKPFSIKHLVKQIENLLLNRKKILEKFNLNKSLLAANESGETEDTVLIDSVNKLIEENMNIPEFGVETLAEKLGMSRSLLYKRVMSVAGIPVGELIRNQKLQKAHRLLMDKRNAVSDVALMVGFSDRPQFSRSFSNMYGMSPKQFQSNRKLQQNEQININERQNDNG